MLKGDWGQKRISKTGGIDRIVRGVRLCYSERANVRRGARTLAEKVNFILSEKTDEIFFVFFGSYIVSKQNILIFHFFGSDFLCPRFRLYLHPGSVCDTM